MKKVEDKEQTNTPGKPPKGLVKRTYRFVVYSLIIFIVTGAGGALLGQFIDEKLETSPIGTLTTMILSYILAWLLILRVKKILVSQIKK